MEEGVGEMDEITSSLEYFYVIVLVVVLRCYFIFHTIRYYFLAAANPQLTLNHMEGE